MGGSKIGGQFGKRKSQDGGVAGGRGRGQDPTAIAIIAVIRDTRGFRGSNPSSSNGGAFCRIGKL